MDGTIVSRDYMDYFWLELIPSLYAEKYNLTIEEAKRRVYKAYETIGANDIRWYLPSFWLNYFKLEYEINELLDKVKERVRFYDDAIEFLREYYDKYYLILSSNASIEFVTFILSEMKRRYSLINPFKRVFSCVYHFKRPKKDEIFYNLICREIGVEPNNMIHVGDDYKYDFVIPRKIGINAFLVSRGNVNYAGPWIIKSLLELPNFMR